MRFDEHDTYRTYLVYNYQTVDDLMRAGRMSVNPETGKWIIRGLNSLETFLFGSSDVMSITGLTPHTLTLTDKGADRNGDTG